VHFGRSRRDALSLHHGGENLQLVEVHPPEILQEICRRALLDAGRPPAPARMAGGDCAERPTIDAPLRARH
jgi:hypothetical protein